ncbi:MAG: cob(I)yrinic acid a,c-diamide adenosyltransferase [Candidatus Methylomirabilales bacterium]
MRVYTRTGDAGETGLLGEARVRKDALRIEAVGSLDEVNAALGLAAAALAEGWEQECLTGVQRDLFAIGAQLADVRPGGRTAGPDAGAVTALERAIDRAQAELPALTRFILPGGSEPAARLHLARSICRRAERRVVALAAQEPVAPLVLAYLNRLSDLLFVLARWANQRAGAAEQQW